MPVASSPATPATGPAGDEPDDDPLLEQSLDVMTEQERRVVRVRGIDDDTITDGELRHTHTDLYDTGGSLVADDRGRIIPITAHDLNVRPAQRYRFRSNQQLAGSW